MNPQSQPPVVRTPPVAHPLRMPPPRPAAASGRQPPAQTHLALYRRIATAFLVLTVATVLLVVYVVLSRGTVVVLSRQDEVKLDSVIDVSRQPIEGEIPGDVLEMSEEASQKFPSTSVVKVEAPAEGRVRIRTSLGRAQTLVATTRLLTPDDKLFRLKETVIVPADGWVEADVFSDVNGAAGEIGPTTFTIPGLMPDTRKHFTVESVTPMAGGVKDIHLVTQSDVAGATEVLKERLTRELTDKLRQKAVADGAKISGEMITVDVQSQLADPAVGAEAAEFSLALKLKVTGIFYEKSQLDRQIAAKIKDLVPFDRELQRVEDKATTLTVEKIDTGLGRANLRVSAKGVSVLSPEAPSLDPAKLTGVTVDAAKSYLEKLDGVSSASVKVSPFWSGRLPNIADHIKVEVR